jgi:hypothetical protein
MLKIEIDAQDAFVQSRTFAGKDGKPARNVYWQVAYMYNGGRYPVRVEIPMEEGVPAYPAGFYQLHTSCFQASKYNKIELNPFNLVLVPFDEKKNSDIKAA